MQENKSIDEFGELKVKAVERYAPHLKYRVIPSRWILGADEVVAVSGQKDIERWAKGLMSKFIDERTGD